MFTVSKLKRLGPCVTAQSLRNLHLTASGTGSSTGSSLRAVRGKRLGSDPRSLLNNNTTQAHCVSTRCLSTATHSEDGNLIYSGSLGTAVRGVKLFSYSTSGASLCLMPHILLRTGLAAQGFAVKAAFCGVIGFFTFLTPVLLHLITKGYVIRLYHNSDRDTYTAITYSVFLTEKRSVFHQRQVRIPAVSQMFTTFYADKTGLLVNPDMFSIPHDYNHLMGYDKPFSFDTDDIDRPDKS